MEAESGCDGQSKKGDSQSMSKIGRGSGGGWSVECGKWDDRVWRKRGCGNGCDGQELEAMGGADEGVVERKKGCGGGG